MSYILGALRKAEQERKNGAGVSLDDWDSDDWNSRDVAQGLNPWLKILLMLIAAALVAIFVLLWVLLKNVPDSALGGADSAVAYNESAVTAESFEDARENAVSEFQEEESSTEEHQLPADQDSEGELLEPKEPPLPKISGHLYFRDNTSLNRIFSEAGSYRVGESVAPGLILIEIAEDQAIFEWNDREYEVRF